MMYNKHNANFHCTLPEKATFKAGNCLTAPRANLKRGRVLEKEPIRGFRGGKSFTSAQCTSTIPSKFSDANIFELQKYRESFKLIMPSLRVEKCANRKCVIKFL